MIIAYILAVLLVILAILYAYSIIMDRKEAEVELFQRTHIIYLLESLCEAKGIEVEKVVQKDP